MNIGLMYGRIRIQRNVIVVDEIGNHSNAWQEYYECACSISGEYGSEKDTAGMTVEHSDIAFTVRYCRLADEVNTDKFRIIFNGTEYDIVSIDHMNYKHKSIKYRCKRVGDEKGNS